MVSEFEEIEHSGGKITFNILTDHDQKRFQIEFTSSRSVHMEMIAVYAIPQGIPVGIIQLGGIGVPWNPPPFPGCFPVFIASDSRGKFGHKCQSCNGYWRSGPWPNICPYCATSEPSFLFLSDAQRRYVSHYCEVLTKALDSGENVKVVIDMNAVVDAIEKKGERPDLYMAEQSQQCKFTCEACEEFNDILGRFGYCSLCGTRNDQKDFENHIEIIRGHLNTGKAPEDCMRDAVALFDSFVSQVAKQLAERVPMTIHRKNWLLKNRFHDLKEVSQKYRDWFDIELFMNMKEDDRNFVVRMFHRRHVYEHNGGEVDQKYLDDSKDTEVRLKQQIRETKEEIHRLLGLLLKMALNIHKRFHELFPPIDEPIATFEDKKARIEKFTKSMKGTHLSHQ
ncbi:MAG: hypothetical protein C75L2_00020046 [Leptospirillum sp. Group II 'C75']|jgi:Zn finger protein HypA/HybF involved in hydrogenase expression|uniref:hypothetical protein n=1 Tax=Leptospirillum sp. Group II 'CF-1' TaxID=1660083 RepID=UPI00029CB1BA|nr:hypothetical protein [Leptospirillum sp. Group II 'CF-1']EIJ75148.1 MAG: hypothetical protein C75L2_00020046 [Leptospirillum sp. Group II 'C75']